MDRYYHQWWIKVSVDEPERWAVRKVAPPEVLAKAREDGYITEDNRVTEKGSRYLLKLIYNYEPND